jgi:phosphoserine phosphatase
MSAGEIARAESVLYKGRTSDEITLMLSSIPTIRGIEETVGYLKRHGIHVLLTTISWTFASRVFAERFGFHDYSGYVMNYLPDGTLSGETARECDEFRKRDFVMEYCDARRISMSEVFAVGDSRSDIPLFQSVGHSVAINASPQAIAAATRSIETMDLREVLALIPDLP